jgi:PAS domain S-box-containing protein
VALFADSLEDAHALLDGLTDRVYGVVATEGESFTLSLISAELWHVVATKEMLPNLHDTVTCYLDIMSHGQNALDENKGLKVELARIKSVHEQTWDSYNDSSGRLRQRIEDLRSEIEVRRTTEEELRKKDFIIHSASSIVATTSLDGKMTYANPEFLSTWGFENLDELLGQPFTDYWMLGEKNDEIMAALMGEDRKWSGELKAKKKDGSLFDVLVSAATVLDDKGKPIALMSTSIDITKRRQAEHALGESEDRLLEAQRIAKLGHYSFNIKAGFWTCSEELNDIFGIDEHYDKTIEGWLAFIDPDDAKMMQDYLQNHVLTQHKEFDKEYRIISIATGVNKWVHGLGSLIFDENQELIEMFGTIQDITERKMVEEERFESEERFRRLAENAIDMIYRMSLPDGTYEFVSPASTQMFGYTPEQFVDSPILIQKAIHPDWLEYFAVQWEALLAGEMPPFYEYQIIHGKTGETRWLHQRNVLVTDDSGQPIAIEGIVTDITDRKHAEKALNESMERLKAFDSHSTEGIYRVDMKEPVPITLPRLEMIEWINKHAVVGEVNDSLAMMYGLTPQGMIGRPALEFAPDYGERAVLVLDKDGYQVNNEETTDVDKDGNALFMLENYHGVIENEHLIAIWGAQNDITERKKSEKALRESEEKFRKYADNAPGIVCIYDCTPDGERKTLYFSSGVEDLLSQMIVDEISYDMNKYMTFIHEDDMEGFQKVANHAEQTNTTFDYEYRVRAATNEYKWMRSIAQSVEQESGNIRWYCQIFDITDHKEAEENQRQQVIFLEGLNKIDQVIHKSVTPEQMLDNVVELVFNLFKCDRAWLLYPCDPEAESFRVPVETCNPDFPGANTLGRDIPMLPTIQDAIRITLAADEPVTFGPDSEHPVPHDVQSGFSVQSQIVKSIPMKIGSAWMFGLHQCAYPRVWTDQEKSLFNEIGRRIADGLSSLIFLRDLKESESRLIEAQKIAHIGNWSHDLVNDEIHWSEESFRMVGIAPQKLTSEVVIPLIHPDDLPILVHAMEESAAGKKESKQEFRILRPDGEICYLQNRWISIYDDNDNEILRKGTHQDITERKLAEEALKISENRLYTFIESATDGFTLWDKEFNLIEINRAELMWYPDDIKAEDMIGKNASELVPNMKSSGRYDKYMEVMRTGIPLYMDGIIPHPRFGDKIFSIRAFKVGEGLGVITTDITDRKIAEDRIRESESKFRTIIEQSNDAIYILYGDNFELINSRFTELTGISEQDTAASDFNFMKFVAPEDHPLIEKRTKMWESGKQPSNVFEFTIIDKSEKRVQVQASVSEIDYRDGKAILGILRDISAQKALEDQLRQAQKIESIGHLAGGIAHDFNNLLTPIIGNSELAMMNLEPSNPLFEDLREINETASRASELTRQLLAFSRKQVLDVKTVNINKLIENFRKILRRTIREDVKIKILYGESIGAVRVDVSQIEQILMNLLVNAQDAMPSGGIITIETESVEFDQMYELTHSGTKAGHYVLLSVSDSGEGMDEETAQMIFDPFFTTKPVGKGTGLGLSTVYGIAKQHGGNIWVYSELGKGTTFKIYLPMVEADSAKITGSSQSNDLPLGSGTILIVEDQEDVRKIATRILQSCGYSVHNAESGNEAISMFEELNLSVDLLLTDVIMPNMNGQELYTQLSGRYPDLKVIFMSGYTQEVISHHGVLDDGINFIQKPLTVSALAKKVKEVIEG